MINHLALAALVAAPIANAAVWNVTVGQGALTFSPTTATPAVGDTLHFVFAGGNHTATQSTFAAPCAAMSGGFNSGYQPVDTGGPTQPTFDVQVNSTDPIWVYCAQAGHCQAGMVFAANPTSNQTFAAFQAAAEGKPTPSASTTVSGTPAPIGPVNAPTPSSSSNSAFPHVARNGWFAVFAGAVGVIAGAVLL
ncbi:hypothetical protein FRB99_000887 [Tulasnella sp. 403]|nr:hypothetical protein FRB99_000887 [Tulasnella sp. 403]